MTDLLGSSAYFGLLLSLGAYGLGLLLQRRWKLPIFNPLLVAIVVVAVVLLLLDLDYGSYSQGAMSSLSIVVAGLLTVVGANLFAHFL